MNRPYNPEEVHARWMVKHSAESGLPVDELSEEAKENLLLYAEEAAAAEGDVDSMENLGHIATRRGDLEEAIRWFKKASKTGDSKLLVYVATTYEKLGKVRASIKWNEKAAKAGSSDAMYNLGLHYWKQDYHRKAAKWFTQAATHGDTDAMRQLATYALEDGDYPLLFEWMNLAAQKGDEKAQEYLRNLKEALQ